MKYKRTILVLSLCGLFMPLLMQGMEEPFRCKVPRDQELYAESLKKLHERQLLETEREKERHEQQEFLKKQSLNFVRKHVFKIQENILFTRLKAQQEKTGCFIAAEGKHIENGQVHTSLYAIDLENNSWKTVHCTKTPESLLDFEIMNNGIFTRTSSKAMCWYKNEDACRFRKYTRPISVTRLIEKTFTNKKTMPIYLIEGCMGTPDEGTIPHSENTHDLSLYEDTQNKPTLVQLTRAGSLSLWDPITKEKYKEIAPNVEGMSVVEINGHTILGTITYKYSYHYTKITLWDISNRSACEQITSFLCDGCVKAIALYKDHLGYPCIITAGLEDKTPYAFWDPRSVKTLTVWEPKERIDYLKTTEQDLDSNTPLPKELVTKVLGYVGSEEHAKQKDNDNVYRDEDEPAADGPERTILPQAPIAQTDTYAAQLQPHKHVPLLTHLIGFALTFCAILIVASRLPK